MNKKQCIAVIVTSCVICLLIGIAIGYYIVNIKRTTIDDGKETILISCEKTIK